jgi:hypothetical protein
MEMELKHFVDRDVLIQIPRFTEKTFRKVKLLAVSSQGVWIKDETLDGIVKGGHEIKIEEGDIIAHFIPYHEIALLTGVVNPPSSEITSS